MLGPQETREIQVIENLSLIYNQYLLTVLANLTWRLTCKRSSVDCIFTYNIQIEWKHVNVIPQRDGGDGHALSLLER